MNHYDYGFRIYNPRIAKFLSVDPLTRSYPWYTPYQFAGNMPIWAIDLDGLEPFVKSGKLYFEVFDGDGPTQVQDFLNDPKNQEKYGYTLQRRVLWTDIVDHPENLHYFDHIQENRYDRDNPAYRFLNLNESNVLAISREGNLILPEARLNIDLNSEEDLFMNTLSLMQKFSIENRLNGREFLEPGKYNLTNFVSGFDKKDGMLDFIGGNIHGTGYKISERNLKYGNSPITIFYNILENDAMTVTESLESFNEFRIITYGANQSNGRASRHISVDFKKDSTLFNAALRFIKGEISADEFVRTSKTEKR